MFVDETCVIIIIALMTTAFQVLKGSPEKVSFIGSVSSQSKTLTNHEATLAIDGDMRTCSIAQQNSDTKELPWWRIQTKNIYNIKNMILYFTTNHSATDTNATINDLEVFVSDDVRRPDKDLCYSFETSENYIRFQCKKVIYGHIITIKRAIESNESLTLCEVEVNLDMKSVNIARRRPTLSKAFSAENDKEFIVDGDRETCVQVLQGYPMLRIDLDYSYFITNVKMYFQTKSTNKAPLPLDAYVSNHTYHFVEQRCGYSQFPYHRVEKDNFIEVQCNNFGKYIYIQKKGELTNLDQKICEVEVFSEEDSLVNQGPSLLQVSLINSKTSQNQMSSVYKSELAIDGNTETCSITEQNSTSDDHPWWRVELDRLHFVAELSLYMTSQDSYLHFMNNLNVYVSNDVDNFEEHLCISFEGPLKIISSRFIRLKCKDDIAGKFVTIKRVGGFKKKMLVLCEVNLVADRKTVNLALGRPTSNNGLFSSKESSLAVDNNLTTCASIITNKDKFAWWRVALDDAYYITDVNMYILKYMADVDDFNVNVFVSNDNNYFENDKCGSSSHRDLNDDGNSVLIICKNPILGTYITIKKYGSTRQNRLLFCEIEIFSKEDRTEKKGKENIECLSHEYKCNEADCIHKDWLCDGIEDCPFGDDEPPLCHTKCDGGKFKCTNRNLCIEPQNRCNSHEDCPDLSDEEDCFSTDGKFLMATFRGESDFYICSTNWLASFSLYVCNLKKSLYLDTQFAPVAFGNPKYLVFTDKTYYHPSLSYFSKNLSCESNKFVKVQCARPETSDVCGTRGDVTPKEDFGKYIISGDKAKQGAWPWHVQLFYDGQYICGGSIIDEMWILTAAHCLNNRHAIEDFYIKVGSVKLNDRTQKRKVSQVAIHPDFKYSEYYYVHDLALIKLRSPLTFTNFVRPVCLPKSQLTFKDLMSFRYCVLSGFGHTDRSNSAKSRPKFLQQGRMNLMTDLECGKELANQARFTFQYSLHGTYIDDILCGGSVPNKNGIHLCVGDTGSALVCRDEDKMWTQVGIAKSVNFMNINMKSLNCSVNIFTKIDNYLSFIRSVMESRMDKS